MKHKNAMCLLLIVAVFFSILAVMTPYISASTPAPVLSIVPTGQSGASSTTVIPAQAVNSTFSVDIRVDNYASVNLGGVNDGVSFISYKVHWDSSVLQMTHKSDVSWLPDQSNMGDLPVDNANGYQVIGQIAFGSDAQETANSVSGSVSATLTFKVLSSGQSVLSLLPGDVGVAYLRAPSADNANHDVTGTITVDAQYGTSPSPTPSPSPSPSLTPTPSPTPSPTPTPIQGLTNIDLFTNKGGVGLNATSGSFAPQELVKLYAYVTYNGAPEANAYVVFTVLSPNNTVISIRTVLTNQSGYAYQVYQTPNIGTSNFGTWRVLASVNVNQVVATDYVTFEYKYPIPITGITLIPSSVSRGSTMQIIVSIQNDTTYASSTKLAITIYDSNNVPIYSYLTDINSMSTAGTISTTATIPLWAFTGQGTVYVNVLTTDPLSGGVPLCPEQSTNFQITS